MSDNKKIPTPPPQPSRPVHESYRETNQRNDRGIANDTKVAPVQPITQNTVKPPPRK